MRAHSIDSPGSSSSRTIASPRRVSPPRTHARAMPAWHARRWRRPGSWPPSATTKARPSTSDAPAMCCEVMATSEPPSAASAPPDKPAPAPAVPAPAPAERELPPSICGRRLPVAASSFAACDSCRRRNSSVASGPPSPYSHPFRPIMSPGAPRATADSRATSASTRSAPSSACSYSARAPAWSPRYSSCCAWRRAISGTRGGDRRWASLSARSHCSKSHRSSSAAMGRDERRNISCANL
mmetsp:Transcript_26059/g.83833  ORF Transcript_26059/g.83833 Transcript_26059/m.83833 type:complete len:240 (-) Transcript_26059:88-807(-)